MATPKHAHPVALTEGPSPLVGQICEFDFSELYQVKQLELTTDSPPTQPAQQQAPQADRLFGRVRMHESCANTRILRISEKRERYEEIDEMEQAGAFSSVADTETFREILPSELLARTVPLRPEPKSLHPETSAA
eukprot:5821032-Prymnesium_polylepis.1